MLVTYRPDNFNNDFLVFCPDGAFISFSDIQMSVDELPSVHFPRHYNIICCDIDVYVLLSSTLEKCIMTFKSSTVMM